MNRIETLEVDDLDVEELDSEGLPELIDVGTYMNKLPKLPLELIKGVVRLGHKMMISGVPKSGKSFLLMQLAIALVEGTKWLGFQCKTIQSTLREFRD